MTAVLAIQARLGSTRLPGKVLLPIHNRPLVLFMAERLRHAQRVDKIVVATTAEATDDPLSAALDGAGVPYFRGPVDDIVGRLLGTADCFSADVLVRVWGDAPYTDPSTVDAAVALLEQEGADFVSTCLDGRFLTTGLDVEVYRVETLRRIANETKAPFFREFPVDYVRSAQPPFRARQLPLEPGRTELNISVDYQEDLELLRAIDHRFGHDSTTSSAKIVALLQSDAELAAMAEKHARNVDYEQKKATQP